MGIWPRSKRQSALETLRSAVHSNEPLVSAPAPTVDDTTNDDAQESPREGAFTEILRKVEEEETMQNDTNHEQTQEEKEAKLAAAVLDHGYEKIDGQFSPPADSMTARHIHLVSSIVESLRSKEASLVQEIANRELDLQEVRFTLYGYESALNGFKELNKHESYFQDAEDALSKSGSVSVEDEQQSLGSNVRQAITSLTEEQPGSDEPVDDPRLPEKPQEGNGGGGSDTTIAPQDSPSEKDDTKKKSR